MKFPVFDTIFIIFLLAVIGLSLSMRSSEGFETFSSTSTTNPSSASNPASSAVNPASENPASASSLNSTAPSSNPAGSTGAAAALIAAKLPGHETIASVSMNPAPKSPYISAQCLENEMGVTKDGKMTCYPYNFSFQTPFASFKIIEHPL